MTAPMFATDLDRTLIYSRTALALGPDAPELVCVERYQDREASFMTQQAASLCDSLASLGTLVPVTTRMPDQLARVRLPGPPARYAIAANGGVLLVDGAVDRPWTAAVTSRLTDVAPLAEIWAEVQRACRPEWTKKLRDADGLFCYAVVDRALLPATFAADTAAWAAERGWQASLQGSKLYWLPTSLTKAAAVAEVARRIDVDVVLAAGDSLLDRDLLLGADRGIHPRHGELFDTGWTAPHVGRTEAAGVLAGQQVLEWFTEQASS